jgi:hypothetical protein
MSEEIFWPIFIPDKFWEAVSGRAWVPRYTIGQGAS